MHHIVFCGGHLAPALAIVEKLILNKNYKIYYFGRKNALEGDTGDSLEYETVTKLNIYFQNIITARIQRALTIYTLFSLLKFPIGIIQSFILLNKIKPSVVVSFGGYVALPIALSAKLLRIPVITHEQTQHLGLANKIISRIADVLCLSFDKTYGLPIGVKTVVTGNPIRDSILKTENKKMILFGDERLPLIYVTGGSTGSRSINKIVAELIPALSSKYRVLHLCGDADKGADFNYLISLKENLPKIDKNNYYVVKNLDPVLIGKVLTNTYLMISRAGANTVNEILTYGIPAILIPLPWAGQNEQEENAKLVESIGLGEVINQNSLTPQLLSSTIQRMERNIDHYKKAKEKAKKFIHPDAADKIVDIIEKYCN